MPARQLVNAVTVPSAKGEPVYLRGTSVSAIRQEEQRGRVRGPAWPRLRRDLGGRPARRDGTIDADKPQLGVEVVIGPAGGSEDVAEQLPAREGGGTHTFTATGVSSRYSKGYFRFVLASAVRHRPWWVAGRPLGENRKSEKSPQLCALLPSHGSSSTAVPETALSPGSAAHIVPTADTMGPVGSWKWSDPPTAGLAAQS